MPTDKTRVGVIGVGRMGQRHCRVYSGLGGVEFVGVSDLSSQRGEAIAGEYHVGFYSDCRDLLEQVDAVSVATPTDSHYSMVKECLSRGVHVLVEKPVAGDPAEARGLLNLANEAHVSFQVGHIERFNPVFLELQAILDGVPVVAVNVRRLSPFDTSNTDVDVVLDLMIHDIDLSLTLLGSEIDCVQAYGRCARTDCADYAVANICFAGGPIATLTSSRVTEQKVRLVEITALGAYIEADLLNKSISIYRHLSPEYLSNHQKPLRYRQESLVERIHIPTAEPLQLELQHFVRCVRDGRRPDVSGEDGLRALEMATMIREQIHAKGSNDNTRLSLDREAESVLVGLALSGHSSRVPSTNVA
ncbi:MAG TPA: Gfo/Idh/MocA family oxidoreductase [Chloroflexota bacterium]|nr:Gfo/Idh/MocA family oxidoreductase [Chloroflexota bacterium]